MAQENSARNHFEVTWLKKARLEVTSRSAGSRKLGSKLLRGHLARENSARRDFEVTWLENGLLEVTSRSLGSRKLGSKSLGGHLAQENAARSHFEVTWLEQARLEDTSRSLASETARSHSTPAQLARGNCSRKLFEETVQGSCHGSTELCITTLCFIRNENGYSRVHTSIYIYRRFGGARSACPTPRNREIGFVSSSFSFRACRACRAWRGEAAWAHLERYPYRWASRVLGSTCVCVFRTPWRSTFVHKRVGFKRFCPKKCGSLPGFCAQACGF